MEEAKETKDLEPASRWQVDLCEAAGGQSTLALVDSPAAGPLLDRDVIVLGHGAGTSAEHPLMESLAHAFLAEGFGVVRFDFPYRRPDTDGAPRRRPPDRMPKLVACFRDVAQAVRERLRPRHLILAGHSMGSRAAAHLGSVDNDGVAGVLLCAYPLHPQGKPDRLRDEVLLDLNAKGTSTLWISGTRDALCRPEVDAAVTAKLGACFSHMRIPGVDHSYEPLKRSGLSRGDVLQSIAAAARGWCGTLDGRSS
ncbi:MAG: putative alpha/beta-hydrolase family hydrolase [Planctomycetota bacterium]|jgi:predicted alpha/beta-hydrolase family hydrolase